MVFGPKSLKKYEFLEPKGRVYGLGFKGFGFRGKGFGLRVYMGSTERFTGLRVID